MQLILCSNTHHLVCLFSKYCLSVNRALVCQESCGILQVKTSSHSGLRPPGFQITNIHGCTPDCPGERGTSECHLGSESNKRPSLNAAVVCSLHLANRKQYRQHKRVQPNSKAHGRLYSDLAYLSCLSHRQVGGFLLAANTSHSHKILASQTHLLAVKLEEDQ